MDWRDEVEERLQHTRRRTLELVEPLSADTLRRRVRDYLSPIVWDLGHIANFEELWLVRAVGDEAVRADVDGLYDALETPRQVRGDVGLPGVDETFAYLDDVRRRAMDNLRRLDAGDDDPLLREGFVYRMVQQHECQHQETMLQALDVPEEGWRYEPARSGEGAGDTPAVSIDDEESVEVAGGEFELGTDDRSRAYDNERPSHRLPVDGFTIDKYPVTVRRWQRFVEDGGYGDRRLWSGEGWERREEGDWQAPQGWQNGDGELEVKRFGHRRRLDPLEPVQHVSFWEARAFARWAGGRLPTEAEWEKAAAWDPGVEERRRWPWGEEPADAQRANLGWRRWGPAAAGSYPASASAYGVEQLLGDVYEWTESPFEAYPGFEAFPYRGYSEVFFGGSYRVLRGASWAASPALARTSYRNWDLPQRRRIFAGLRLVWGDA